MASAKLVRHSLFAVLFASSFTFAACGGGDDSTGDDTGGTPTGDHNHFVVNKVNVPTSPSQSAQFGLDLDADEPDGDEAADNQLGGVLAALASQNVDVQTTIDTSVNSGGILLLADFQTEDFTNAATSGFSMLLGDTDMITPDPCDDENDTTCGNHLDGNGMFVVDASSPNNAALAGPVAAGTFSGGPGNLTLQITLTGGAPLNLNLIGAKAKLSGISANGITSGVVAGAISDDDLNNNVLPAIGTQITAILTESSCTGDGTDCNCPNGAPSSALTIASFDQNGDCSITGAEIKTSAVGALLSPDVTIDGVAALSLGVGFTAVKGTFN